MNALTIGRHNIGIGYQSLLSVITGISNVCIGAYSGQSYIGGESDNILIGDNVEGIVGDTHTIRIGAITGASVPTSCYIQGIYGITVTGSAVLCSSSGQLGTVASSKRYKENIKDIDDQSILGLRPVQFNFKSDSTKTKSYGFIAEEVLSVCPDLVILKNDKPESVKYHEMPALLLNEIQINPKEWLSWKEKNDNF